MACYGTKCANDSSHDWRPETLGSLYLDIANEYGSVQINKPRVGDTYRKMHKPISQMDGPAFRQLPTDIIVLSPPRLFRSHGWKYKGKAYIEAEYYWEFEYETAPYIANYRREWLSVRILSYTYINSTLTFQTGVTNEIKLSTPTLKITNYQQLQLF